MSNGILLLLLLETSAKTMPSPLLLPPPQPPKANLVSAEQGDAIWKCNAKEEEEVKVNAVESSPRMRPA